MSQHEHVYAICCRLESVDDVISGQNVKTIECYVWTILKLLVLVVSEIFKTRKPTNWWGSAKRDVAHPTATVVYNTCYNLFRNVHA